MNKPKAGTHTWVPRYVLESVMVEAQEAETFIDVVARKFNSRAFMDEDIESRPAFKRRHYRLDDLAVGATRTFAWRVDLKGYKLDQRPIHNAIRNYEKKSGRAFNRIPSPVGLVVQRIK